MADLFMLVIGVAIGVWALALLTNFRGYADSQLRRSFPRRPNAPAPGSAAWRFGKATQRVVAGVMLVAAIALMVGGVIGLVRR